MCLDVHPAMRELVGTALNGLLSNPNFKPSEIDHSTMNALAVIAIDIAEEVESELTMRDSKARQPRPQL